uniref:Uncharacterized protein n=1 Tax=Nonomuraea gerenzanensis TaxID=93944 RepID=A0A1M4E8Z1_9ACTN|nr:hypothetical protein BN4615_P4639 [Nonomuraea gerenzanensis]
MLEPPGLRRRLQPQLLVEDPAQVVVGQQGLAPPPRPAQALDEAQVVPLVERVPGDERAQLRHQLPMVAEPQVRLQPQLHGPVADLLQVGEMPGHDGPRRDVGQRAPPPQAQPVTQPPRRLLGGAGAHELPALRHGVGERLRVELPGLHPQQVAGRLGHQHVRHRAGGRLGGQCRAQVVHVGADRADPPAATLPQLLGDRLHVHDLVGAEQQQGQDLACLPALGQR